MGGGLLTLGALLWGGVPITRMKACGGLYWGPSDVWKLPYTIWMCSGARFQRSEELGFCCDMAVCHDKVTFCDVGDICVSWESLWLSLKGFIGTTLNFSEYCAELYLRELSTGGLPTWVGLTEPCALKSKP